MLYDSLTLACCVAEMRAVLSDMIVHQVRQPEQLDVILVCRAGQRHAEVLLSAHPHYARAHLSTVRQKVPQAPPGFCQLLRKHLEGKRISHISQIARDRIMRIDFDGQGGAAPMIMHEIMGRHSNIVLVSEATKVLGAAKVVTQRISRTRQIIPGRDYQLPPQPKRDASAVSALEFESLWESEFPETPDRERLQKWIVQTFVAFSPTLAAECTEQSEMLEPASILETMKRLLSLFDSEEFSPVLIRRPGSPVEEVYPVPLLHLPPDIQHRRPTISEPLEAAVRHEIGRSGIEEAREQLLRSIDRACSEISRNIEHLTAILDHPEEPELLRRKAEILAGHFHLLQSGATEVELPDYYDPEMRPTLIEIRPDLSPQQNVDRYFTLARKAADRLEAAGKRLEVLKKNTGTLRGTSVQVRSASSIDEIRERRASLENARLLQRAPVDTGTSRDERPFGGMRIRSVTSEDGFEILVGETAEANDYLTTRVAQPNDIWLHARAVTGAHVVIRTGGHSQVPPRTINHAARIAADRSDAKHSAYVPVDWTWKKHVRKPRRSAPGLATYTHEKTIHVTRQS